MVDREARNQLAELLRHFAAGRLTWRDFVLRQEPISISTRDPVVHSISTKVWYHYSCGCEDIEDAEDALDLASCERCREPRPALDRAERREVARWIVFLYSDREYEWQEGRLELALAWYGFLAFAWLSAALG